MGRFKKARQSPKAWGRVQINANDVINDICIYRWHKLRLKIVPSHCFGEIRNCIVGGINWSRNVRFEEAARTKRNF